MRVIIPMAGMGKRMRPHTLTVPKPLIKVAGKPIVQRLVEDISKVIEEKIEEVAFVIGRFGEETEQELIRIANKLGAKGSIYYQDEALGTAHAILCAGPSISGKVIVAFADTLFKADFKVKSENDGTIWVQKIDDPSAFGVVKVNGDNIITDFVEKPRDFVSDLAIIGIYYFNDGDWLKNELQYLIDNDIREKGEYQLTNALENMKQKGAKFSPGKITEWLDCGNKDATVFTNQRILEFNAAENLIHSTASIQNTVILEPCFIGENCSVSNTVIGPHVSLGPNTVVKNAVVSNSIVQEDASLQNCVVKNSMIGRAAQVHGNAMDVSISDYSIVKC